MKSLRVAPLLLILSLCFSLGPAMADKKHSLIVYTVFFELRSAELAGDEALALEEMAKLMDEDRSYEVKLVAYTDPEEEDEDDEDLAKDRAAAVREVFLLNGIDHDRIDREIEGDDDEFGQDDSEADRALRRRVEVRVRQVTDSKRKAAKTLDKGADTHLQTTVFFAFDSAEVRSRYLPMLQRIGRMLERNEDFRIGLFGHTDGIGSDSYNEALGTRRCEAVRGALVASGAPKEAIYVESLGEEEALGSQGVEATTSRGLSRSVEIKIVEIDD